VIVVLLGCFSLFRDESSAVGQGGSRNGGLTIFMGSVGMIYFLLFFDVGVSSPLGRVANLDLMQQRQNGIIASGIVMLAGTIWAAQKKDKPPKNPFDK